MNFPLGNSPRGQGQFPHRWVFLPRSSVLRKWKSFVWVDTKIRRGGHARDDEPRDFVWAGARTLDPVSTAVHVESNQDDLMARKFQLPIITVNGSWFAKERG